MTPTDNKNWELFERLAEVLGHEELATELMQAMSTKEANENLDYLAQMHIDKL